MKFTKYENHRDTSSEILISENTNNAFEAHFHRNIELLYIRNGQMQAVINEIDYTYSAEEIVYVPSYYSHEFTTLHESEVIVLQIPYELLSGFNEKFRDKTFDCKLTNKEANRKIFEILQLMIRNISLKNDFILKGYANLIVGILYAYYPMRTLRLLKSTDIIINIFNYIDSHYMEKLTLEHIAKVFNYNKYYISKLFNSCSSNNFSQYINFTRISHFTSQYNKSPGENITDLALQCGFDSISSFYRAFKNTYGKTPKEFFDSASNNTVSLYHYDYLPQKP